MLGGVFLTPADKPSGEFFPAVVYVHRFAAYWVALRETNCRITLAGSSLIVASRAASS